MPSQATRGSQEILNHPEPNIAKNLPRDNVSAMVSHTTDWSRQLTKTKPFQCLWSNTCKLHNLQCREYILFKPTEGDPKSHRNF